MSLIVYADFVCPECYLASRRADALRACGVEFDWRAVEHDRRLTVGPQPISAADQDALTHRCRSYRISCCPARQVDRGPITMSAFHRIRAWRAEWRGLVSPALPVVLSDGATLSGLDALRRPVKEISYSGAQVEPEPADPRRYPAIAGAPHAAWVSQIGGRWSNAHRVVLTPRSADR